VALIGCNDFPGVERPLHAIVVENRTPSALTFEMVVGDRQQALIGPVRPGVSDAILIFRGAIPDGPLVGEDGCTKGTVIAYDPEGQEVARHPPGLCIGETWVVEP
jgi:hypothetical protein